MTNWLGSPGFRKILLAAALLLVCQPAFADKRVALILGNSAYQNAPPLANPVNDSALIAARLKAAGFDVVDSRRDLSALQTRRALRDFEDNARDADIAVVYYAGHGIEVDGTNYLIPVDAKLERDSDVYDEALSLDRVLVAVEPAKKLRLVILDACRDNPFAKTMKRAIASRGISSGLAKIEPTSPNTLIAYSAKAGSTAQDGDGKNSPFTTALASHLTTPGLDVRKAFGFVRDDVLKATSNRQEPFVYGSLGGNDVALVAAPAAPIAAAPQPAASSQADARRDYELAMQVGSKAALEAFLAQYPNGFYASLARSQLDKIATAAPAAPAKPQPPAPVQVAKGLDKPADASSAAPAVPDKSTNVAALTAGAPPADLARSVQAELRRVGCLTSAADGNWNATSQRSLSQFNRYAGTKFDTKAASSDALDALKQKSSRVCPLVCEHGYKADGNQCIRIVCAEGAFLNDDNECEKRRDKRPVVTRDRPDSRQAVGRRSQSSMSATIPAPPAATSRPLTGSERQWGCNSNEAIMSGKCP
ncbi:caspase family protein [Bradyrhizobium sp. Tv2a-2]|uniref:caspase family protein n=1 Tax=Bradyrhizobium sp. Tv2a-2 TaxID=113395 RepID=UPI000410FEF7|nr:caspase family protein [Bradyrhizobium sp. Tv2a-2]